MLNESAKAIVVDCDAGRDDAIALFYAIDVGLKPRAVVGTYGNTIQSNVIRNCLDVLSWAKCSAVPVFSGATMPGREHWLIERMIAPKQASSGNGLCNVTLPTSSVKAHEVDVPELATKLEALSQTFGLLDYLILGPATTAWLLVQYWEGSASRFIRQFTMMGGRLGSSWEAEPIPDFNIGCDPFAVKGLLSSAVAVRFVPLNVTWDIQLPLDDIRSLVPVSPIGEVTKTLMERYCVHFSPYPVFRFHDPTTVYALLNEHYFRSVNLNVNVDVSDQAFGRLFDDDVAGFAASVFSISQGTQTKVVESILAHCGLR